MIMYFDIWPTEISDIYMENEILRPIRTT